MKKIIQVIYLVFLDMIVVCGDVNCNVMCVLNFYQFEIYFEVYEWFKKLSDDLLLWMRVYYEIWFDEERVVGMFEEEVELMYGLFYLLWKFKIGIVVLLFNDIDVFL